MEASTKVASRRFVLMYFLLPHRMSSHMAQLGTDQHKGRITVCDASDHAGSESDFPVQPFNHIIGADASPVFTGKIAVVRRFLNAILRLFGGQR